MRLTGILYISYTNAMKLRGITCINYTRVMGSWDTDQKILHPHTADKIFPLWQNIQDNSKSREKQQTVKTSKLCYLQHLHCTQLRCSHHLPIGLVYLKVVVFHSPLSFPRRWSRGFRRGTDDVWQSQLVILYHGLRAEKWNKGMMTNNLSLKIISLLVDSLL